MQLGTNGHVTEESLESYALGSLEEPALGELEEHLLLCSRCQDLLKEIDEYHTAMKSAAMRLESQQESRKMLWTGLSSALTVRRLGWTMALVAVALGGLALRTRLSPTALSPAVTMVLETSRGSEVQHAPAGRVLDLSLDIKGLPAYPLYGVETVDASGRMQAQSRTAVSEGRVKTSLSKGLRPGNYFIRLYTPSRELLREYGLVIDQ
jgi:anti-sigma factor RsiW